MLTGETKLTGILGWPISHSRSPQLHGYWLEKYGIDGAYVPLPAREEHFQQSLRVLGQLGFRGVNVTVPHKEAALKTVDRIDAQAKRMGAVNTVIYHPDGSLEGRNTDGLGFLAHLREATPAWQGGQGPAAVFGAGGAARAVIIALQDAGVPEIRLVNRTLARAESLALALGGNVKVVNWINRTGALRDATLVVNTTTQGMVGQAPLEIELVGVAAGATVYDCVYAPLDTPLLVQARKRGLVAVDGLGMLIHQARYGFAAWWGIEPEVSTELTAFVGQGL